MKYASLLLLLLFILALPVLAAPGKKLFHDVAIADISITQESLQCSKSVFVHLDVVNRGSFMEDAYVALVNKELQVDTFSLPFQVQPQSRYPVVIPLFFAKEPKGTFTFTTYLYVGKTIKESFRTFSFKGCTTLPLAPPVAAPRSFPLQDHSTASQPVAGMQFILGALVLLVLLIILSILALVRLI